MCVVFLLNCCYLGVENGERDLFTCKLSINKIVGQGMSVFYLLASMDKLQIYMVKVNIILISIL